MHTTEPSLLAPAEPKPQQNQHPPLPGSAPCTKDLEQTPLPTPHQSNHLTQKHTKPPPEPQSLVKMLAAALREPPQPKHVCAHVLDQNKWQLASEAL